MIGTASLLGLLAFVVPAQATVESSKTEELARALEELGSIHELRVAEGPALTIAELFRSVRAHHPRQRIAEARRVASERERLAASGAYDPFLFGTLDAQPAGAYDATNLSIGLSQLTPLWGASFSGGYRLSAGELPPYYLEKDTLEAGELALGIEVPLLRDGNIDAARARLGTSEAQLEFARAEQSAAELELLRDAAQKYFAWVAASRQYVVGRWLLDLAETRDVQIRRQVEQGALPEIERLDNVRIVLARRDGVLELERRLERAAIELSLYTRDEGGSPIVIRPERAPAEWSSAPLPKTPIETAIAQARRRRPELAAIEALRSRLEVELRLAQNRTLPRLDVALDLSKDLGAANDASGAKLEPWSVLLGAKLEMPVLLRESRGQRDAVEARLREQAAALQWAEDRIVQDVRDAHSALSVASRRVTVLRLAAESAEEVAQAERRRFELGSSSLINVNIREQAAAAARIAMIDAEAELRRAELAFALSICDPELVNLERVMSTH